jgi:hemerythrin superfamily protein
MSDTKAAEDVIAILLEQHARVRQLFGEVKTVRGDHRKQAFDELRALLAVHETAEEMIVRPVSGKASEGVAKARNEEEAAANKVLAQLEKMGVDDPRFEGMFADFERSVLAHAEQEEREEFPLVREARTPEQLRSMGKTLRMVERFAPTHPHPAAAGSPMAQWTVGPFAAIVDRVKDAVRAR